MKTLTAKDAKYRFGCLIDLARAEPVVIVKHGRLVVVVLAAIVTGYIPAFARARGCQAHPHATARR
jgi:prevent-host-death family protein